MIPQIQLNTFLKKKICLNDIDISFFMKNLFLNLKTIETYLAFVPKGFKSFKMPMQLVKKNFFISIIKTIRVRW